MKQEWKHCSLGEALTFQRGFDITKKEQRDGPYKVISSSGPKSTHIDFKAKGPGVVIGRKGTLGSVFYTEEDYWPHDTSLWIKDFHGNDPKFAYYFLQTMGFEKLDVGAANPSLNRNHIHTIPVRYPDLPTQRKIAGILSAYDDLIENNLRRIKILEEMAQSLYREWFVHFRFPGHETVEMVDSPMGVIPEGWEVKTVEELLDFHVGGGWGKDVADDKHTKSAFVIRGTDIPDARLCCVDGVPFRYHSVSNLRNRKLQAGDIVFEVSGGSKGQPVGRSLFVNDRLMDQFGGEEVMCASFCKLLRPNFNALVPELLFYHLLEIYDDGRIDAYQVQSTGITNFKFAPFLEQEMVVVPPSRLQTKWREVSADLLLRASLLGVTTQNLRETRDLLLPKLLSAMK
jgi:type I restriction enzyme S subunit